MKPAIRALGIATIIIWIFLIAFSVTALYSVMNLGFGFGEVQFLPSTTGVVLSLPFFINNSGYYDLSELNITTRITDSNETALSVSETFVPLVSTGNSVEAAHNISIDLSDVMERIGLIFEDSFFVFETFVALNFARFVPVQLSMNMTVPWGAPFNNVSVGEISVLPFNSTHVRVGIPLSFENNSYFDITGTMKLEMYNDVDELVTFGETSLDAPSQSMYNDQINMQPADASKLTDSGQVHFIFETPVFTVEQWMPYG
ncbi:MAG: hypothetical protein JSV12_05100 [Candidatus Bathyarchaeota archaeon]|nr:MAG: hypothetical protein JSV12_05100 [Candidatus Bathyarchaeota archaeon]